MNRLKALLLGAGGIAVCAAIFAGIVVIAVDHLVSDDALPDVLAGSIVFGIGALIVLAIAGRAALRAYRGEALRGPEAWLAYAVPGLALPGLLFGAWFMVRIVREHHTYSAEAARQLCELTLGTTLSDADRTRCMPVARRCNQWLRENPPRAGRGTSEIETDPTLASLSFRDAASVRCMRDHGLRP